MSSTPIAPAGPAHSFVGRVLFFVLVLIGLTWIILTLTKSGWEPTWQQWGIESRSPFFSDLRVVTGSVDTVAQGGDPMIANPGAPFQQVFNQPRLWIWIFTFLELDDGTSPIVGLALEGATLVALWWILRGISIPAALFAAVFFFSPAVMLMMERCNNDLFLFFFLALAYWIYDRSTFTSTALIFFSFLLKLFPLAGLLLFLREPKGRALRFGCTILLLAAAYFVLTWHDLEKIWRTTEKGGAVSYGYKVLATYMDARQPQSGATVIKWYLAAILLGAGLIWWLCRRPTPTATPTGRELDAYRIGAGIYCGTFLLGNSWDYRLTFLFFVIPQLSVWVQRGTTRERCLAIMQAIAILIAVWAQWSTLWFPYQYWTVRISEEIAKAWIFFGSLYFLAYTLPDWARAWLRFEFKSPKSVFA